MIRSIWDETVIGNVVVKNRLVMPPMSTRLSNPDGSVTENLIRYYEARARGGVGLIIVEYSFIDNDASKAAVCQLGVYSDDLLPGLSDLTERLQYYGTKVFLQLCHGGGQSPSSLIKRQPLAPSAIHSKSGEIPAELTIQGIKEIVASFGEGALRAKRAGFDGIEIHGAHGYLINQFLSPLYNKRTDAYGPDFSSRSRFPIEVVKEIRKMVGQEFPVGFRLNVRDYIPGGIEIEESLEFIKMLENNSFDYIHASAGTYLSHQYMISPIYLPRGHLEKLAKRCKAEVKIPVIAVGGIDHQIASKIVKNKSADMVALGRALIADPNLPNKFKSGKQAEIRPCIRCNEGCIGRFFEGKAMRCATNPSAGREAFLDLSPTGAPKKVAIVGAGVAGMEAARVAKKRGHDVTVYERTNKLGGNVNIAAIPAGKTAFTDLITWYEGQLHTLKVDLNFNANLSRESLEKISPDVVLLAVGAKHLVPPIPGVENQNVINAIDVLAGKKDTGETVVIIGAGLVGIETALHLNKNKPKAKITILESLESILVDVVRVNALAIEAKLEGCQIEIITSVNVIAIGDANVIYMKYGGERRSIPSETVILAAGFLPDVELEKELVGLSSEVHRIGDCYRAGKIIDAIDMAAVVASKL